MYTKIQREEYNIHRSMVSEQLGITVNQYNMFRRIGEALHKVYENDCNGVYNDSEEAEGESMPLYLKANKLAKSLKLFIYYQTDPRGATIYLDTVEIPQDNYTKACCIY